MRSLHDMDDDLADANEQLEADRRNLVALGAYARHAFACNMKSPHREIGDKCDCGYRKAEQALGESLREEIDG